MKAIQQAFLVIATCVLAGGGTSGRAESQNANTLETEAAVLRHDYPDVAVVAHLRCDKAEAVERIGGKTGYVSYRVSGHVVEAFKGRLRHGQKLAYYSMAEASYPPAFYRGNKIVFLNLVSHKGKWVYSALENSTHQATTSNIAVLRKFRVGANDQRIVPGVRIGRVSLGDSQKKVRRYMGAPVKTVALPGGFRTDWWRAEKPDRKGAHTLKVIYRRGVVVQVAATNPAYQTNIHLSSDLDVGDWVRAYGGQRAVQHDLAQHGSRPKLPAIFNMEEASYRYAKRRPDTLKYFDWVQRGLAVETENDKYQTIHSVIVHRRGFRVMPDAGGQRLKLAPTVTSPGDGE